ncbi:MAG: hypothetical protein MI924_00950 [Chloroflexales bacterium]|nr:hypothetical protein [Chloroflexales bacterium]
MQPDQENGPARDAITRMLHRLIPSQERLWSEAKKQVSFKSGYLILDDSTQDKLYRTKIELVTYHWSGKHKKVAPGINLLTLLWTDGALSSLLGHGPKQSS